MSNTKILAILLTAVMLCIGCSKDKEVEIVPAAAPENSPVDKALDLVYNMDYLDAINYATDVMNNEGESVEMLTVRGVAHAKMNRQYDSFRDLNAAVKLEHSAYTLFNLGNSLRMFGHCVRAADAYEAALALEPANQAIMLNLVSAHVCYGNTDAASEVFLKLVSNFPQDATAFTTAAILKATVDSFDESITAAKKAVSIDATYKPAYKVLEMACQRAGDTACAQQAQAEYTKLEGQSFRSKTYKRKPKR